jgi:hypothetical protein
MLAMSNFDKTSRLELYLSGVLLSGPEAMTFVTEVTEVKSGTEKTSLL